MIISSNPAEYVERTFFFISMTIIENTSTKKWLSKLMPKCSSRDALNTTLDKKYGLKANNILINIVISNTNTLLPNVLFYLYSIRLTQAEGTSSLKNAATPDNGNKNKEPAIICSCRVDSKSKPM